MMSFSGSLEPDPLLLEPDPLSLEPDPLSLELASASLLRQAACAADG
jgi:hypothetical protein